VSQSQSGGFVYLRVSMKAGCVSESVWRLGVSLSHSGGWVCLSQSGGFVCLSQSGGFVCLRVSLEASCVSESV